MCDGLQQWHLERIDTDCVVILQCSISMSSYLEVCFGTKNNKQRCNGMEQMEICCPRRKYKAFAFVPIVAQL